MALPGVDVLLFGRDNDNWLRTYVRQSRLSGGRGVYPSVFKGASDIGREDRMCCVRNYWDTSLFRTFFILLSVIIFAPIYSVLTVLTPLTM